MFNKLNKLLWLTLLHVLIIPRLVLGLKHIEDNEETYRKYYNYVDMTSRLRGFAQKYSHICRLESIGKSVEARELWVMRITTSPSTEEPGKPKFKYVGNIHGDEALSRQLLVYLIEFMLTQYGRDAQVTDLVNRTDIYIMPSMNPDGFEKASPGDCVGNAAARNNAKNRDLSEAFYDESDADSAGKTHDNVPEVTAVVRWILEKKFVLSGSLHGGLMKTSYPFDDSSTSSSSGVYTRTADDALFQFLAQTYTENHSIMKMGSSHCSEDLDKSFNGGMQDFNYFRGNCFEVTFELSCCKYPEASQLHVEWTHNQKALLAYMQNVHIGVKGFVLTSSGLGLADATISVSGIDNKISASVFGDYYRLLLPGHYNITASSPGYLSMTILNVPVTESIATLLNFTLEEPRDAFTTSEMSFLTREGMSTAEPSTPKSPIQTLDFQHHSYDEMEMFLQLFNAIHPSITYLYSVGKSVQGRNLYVMELSNNPGGDDQSKPKVLFVGNMHGNEIIGREVLLNLVEYLCRNYGKDLLVTQLLNSTKIHILPSMNPDGYEFALRAQKRRISGDLTIIGRGNSHNVDLNTNFPDRSKSKIVIEPETSAIMNWIKSEHFVMSASLRGGFMGVVYPSSLDSVDEKVFKSVAEAFNTESQALQKTLACDVPRSRDKKSKKHRRPVITGTDWLTWAYRSTDTFAVDIGLSCELFSPEEALSVYWEKNHGALIRFIQQAHLFVRGTVTDELSGKAIANATILAKGSQHEIHTSRSGQYWRPLAPGFHHITASALGYTSTSASVQVLGNQVEPLDFALTPSVQQLSGVEAEPIEFERLVEWLVRPGELDQLVRSLLPAGTLQYRNYKELSEFLRGLTLNFPHITRLYSLGQSTEFRTIWALEISGNLGKPQPDEPKILFVAGVHGNAAVGPELLLELASVLCLNHGRNLAITELVDKSRIMILPSVNPDGRELAQEGHCSSSKGYTNAQGIDLDSDFFYGNASIQPETRAVMSLIHGGRFSVAVVLDGGSLLATYPYDRPGQNVENEKTLRYLASLYADSHPQMHLGSHGCTEGFEKVPGGILKGSDFRPHTGSMKDFSLDVGVCPEITVYTGCCMYPPETQLFSLWMENRLPLFRMLLEVHRRLSGVVRDEEGRPVLDAVVVVNGSVNVHADSQGFFSTLLAPGTHQLQVQARGYRQKLQQVNISLDRASIPIMVNLMADRAVFSQTAVIISTAALSIFLICALLFWRLRTAKHISFRDWIHWFSRDKDSLQMEAMASEKSPLRQDFVDESESEDDPFFVEGS